MNSDSSGVAAIPARIGFKSTYTMAVSRPVSSSSACDLPVLHGAKNRPRSDPYSHPLHWRAERGLVQRTHERTHVPAHAAQSVLPQLDQSLRNLSLRFVATTLLPAFNQRRSGEELYPALDDFLLSPFACTRLIDMRVSHREPCWIVRVGSPRYRDVRTRCSGRLLISLFHPGIGWMSALRARLRV